MTNAIFSYSHHLSYTQRKIKRFFPTHTKIHSHKLYDIYRNNGQKLFQQHFRNSYRHVHTSIDSKFVCRFLLRYPKNQYYACHDDGISARRYIQASSFRYYRNYRTSEAAITSSKWVSACSSDALTENPKHTDNKKPDRKTNHAIFLVFSPICFFLYKFMIYAVSFST